MGNRLHPPSEPWPRIPAARGAGMRQLVLNQPSSEGRNGAWSAPFPSLGSACSSWWLPGRSCLGPLWIIASLDPQMRRDGKNWNFLLPSPTGIHLQNCHSSSPFQRTPPCLFPCSKGCLGIPPASVGMLHCLLQDCPCVPGSLLSCLLAAQPLEAPSPTTLVSVAVGPLLGSGCCSPWNMAQTALEQPWLWNILHPNESQDLGAFFKGEMKETEAARDGRQGLEAKRAVRNDSPSWHFPSMELSKPCPPGLLCRHIWPWVPGASPGCWQRGAEGTLSSSERRNLSLKAAPVSGGGQSGNKALPVATIASQAQPGARPALPQPLHWQDPVERERKRIP